MQTSDIMEVEDVSPKVSLKRNGSFICVAAPFLYDKLPEEPLKLSILKLDGSSFVPRNGSVEDLKQSVVEAFSNCKISWLHVWGHFCLSYCGQKLISDDDLIGTYGIKDGDELSFMRHVSIGYNPKKTQTEGEDHQFDEPRVSNDFDDKEDNEHQDDSENDEDNISEDENNGGVLGSCQYKLFHLFRGLFSYQKLENSERRVEQKTE